MIFRYFQIRIRRKVGFYLSQDDVYSPSHIIFLALTPTNLTKEAGHQDPKQRLTKQRPAELLRVNVYIIIGEYTRTM